MPIKGIDVSKYQGNIDWPAVRADGVEFAMIRAGYGMYAHQKDPYFDQNVQGAQAAGVHVGAYHYSYAQSVEDARREAELFLSWVAPYSLDYPVAFDIEDGSQEGLSSETLTQIVETFCGIVEAAGYYTMVYANKFWLQHKLIYERVKRWDIWLAHYAAVTDYDREHGIWQCSSQAKISGIAGNCDLDWAYRDYPALIRERGLNGFSAETVPGTEPPPAPEESTTAYRVGDVVVVSSYYKSSTEADSNKATILSAWKTGTITRVIPGARNPYLLNSGALGWCNDGDIRGYAEDGKGDQQNLIGSGGAVYVVQPGDTLSEIAARYGTSWQRLAQHNGIADPSLIHPGERITIA